MMMGQTLVRAYDHFTDAQGAREALLGSGFAPDSVHLDSIMDEAGPVEGNGVIDTKDMGRGPGSKPGPFIMSREVRTDAYNNADPVWRGTFVLTVDADDERQRSLASDIMERYAADAGGLPPRGRS
ncbi:hypothetical protein TSA66_24370 [Noviherbaspirillum autotrophicum]|uniref:Uncharacterized protein n=2 Tax=Noviherbaspirillum autotrophicum TaxID=709839 RepID=A0A0C2BZ08_9BURK|nr:hypothetical protein TSA66_24370 [Noviherbaspirillum autotrophicum]